MQAASTQETPVNLNQSTGRHNPEDSHVNIRSPQNLKSYLTTRYNEDNQVHARSKCQR